MDHAGAGASGSGAGDHSLIQLSLSVKPWGWMLAQAAQGHGQGGWLERAGLGWAGWALSALATLGRGSEAGVGQCAQQTCGWLKRR